jgi:hypothetical protein
LQDVLLKFFADKFQNYREQSARPPVSPTFVVFGHNISEASKSICDNFGIPVFGGFDEETILAELNEVTREVSGQIDVREVEDKTELPPAEEIYQRDQQEDDAKQYAQILNALQPENQNWRDLEY